MGVMKCNRNGCDNIMCQRHSYDYGYICWECYDEMDASNQHPQIFMSSIRIKTPLYAYNDIFKHRDEEDE